MQEIKENTYKGTRILLGNKKRDIINKMIDRLKGDGFTEIQIPIIQFRFIFEGKVGEENQHMMYSFKDMGNRDLVLAPEYTAVVQSLRDTFKYQKDVHLFYVQECFRGEKPQSGRYRQFTQLGVEIINPTKDYSDYMEQLAVKLIPGTFEITLNKNAKRGLDYYKNGKGFEIVCGSLGSSKQLCGGGEYEGGIGFAIGIDRLLNLIK